jgi:flavin reductase (DIM6/NTAB) family NADH-FMN oxidoreductase RutF
MGRAQRVPEKDRASGSEDMEHGEWEMEPYAPGPLHAADRTNPEPIDAQTFKEVMSRWASGITVITCRGDEGVHGMTASSFCSVSLKPPLMLVCVDRQTRTHGLIQEQGAFGVHILSPDMEEVSNRCAGFNGEEGHWLEDLPWHVEVTGAPILDHALSWMDCSVWRAYEGGDHTIYVGMIHAAGATEGSPLLWFERAYRHLAE